MAVNFSLFLTYICIEFSSIQEEVRTTLTLLVPDKDNTSNEDTIAQISQAKSAPVNATIDSTHLYVSPINLYLVYIYELTKITFFEKRIEAKYLSYGGIHFLRRQDIGLF